MRILIVNTYHYLRGGDSAYALGISRALEEAGHEVFPFAMQGERNLPSPYARYFAPELDYPALQREGGVGNKIKVLTHSIYNREARSRLSEYLDEIEIDIAHLHSVMHHLTASVVLELRKRGIPIVWTLHDAKSCCPTTHFQRNGQTCHACYGGRFYQAVRYRCKRGSLSASAVVATELYLHRLWKIYERAELLIAPSRFLRDTLIEAGLRPRRIEVLPNYVEAKRFQPAQDEGSYFLYLGRLSPEKGVTELVEAAVRLPHIPLRIVGGGELEASLRQRVEASGSTHITVEGPVPPEQVTDILRGARALILPSRCDENCPLVVLEAFAAGRPVIASSRGGIPELVNPGKTGLLVSDASVESWTQILESGWNDPAGLQRMGSRGREIISRRYDRSAHLEALLELYRSVLGGKESG